MLGLEQVAQPVLTQIAQCDLIRETTADQLLYGLGQDNLTARAGCQQA